MNDELSSIQELFGEEILHCTKPFSGSSPCVLTQIDTLPYHDLGDHDFERLCYELLLSKGYEPRFFGRRGQAQYGVDVVAEKDGSTEVYQCKNLGSPPTEKQLGEYLNKFEVSWLGKAALPSPALFVICCPQPLRDLKIDEKWIATKTAFEERTKVGVRLWDVDLLDGWLRKLPDLVADLFSDRHAETFCGIDDWKPDLFIPVRSGISGDRRLKRYFNSRRQGRLYLDERRQQQLTERLDRSPVILVRGLPGTGKTFTALAVADGFDGGHRRTYFVDVSDDEFTKSVMREGIRRRMSRPSMFVLENCHEKLDAVEQVLGDLSPQLKYRRTLIICLGRWIPSALASRTDESDLFLELEADDATVDFENDDALLQRVLEFWRPEFTGLSKERLSKLISLCGRDLYLFDEVLALVQSPGDVDQQTPADMYDRIRRAYFGSKTADEFPGVRRLAALAQLDIRPRADVLGLSQNELDRMGSLCVRAGHPPRWQFLHSTAAELVLHALWSGMGVTDSTGVAREAAKDIIDYFRDLQAANLRPAADAAALEIDILRMVLNPLKLADEAGQKALKAAVLDSEPVQHLLPRLMTLPTYPRTIYRCASAARWSGAATIQAYARQVRDAVADVVKGLDIKHLTTALPVVSRALNILKRVAPALHAELNLEMDPRRLLDMLESGGTIVMLFKIIEWASPDVGLALIEALDEARVDRLLHRTIATGSSIGTLNLTLRRLRLNQTTKELGLGLERAIGSARFMQLIEANGTVYELFRLVQDTSPELATRLVEALDEITVERLVEKTISSRRSIGTLNLTLHVLRMRKDGKTIAQHLEQAIGPARFMKLIEANGTVYELFKLLEETSSEVATQLLEALDETRADWLVERTLRTGRSVGTLHLTLDWLRKRKDGTEIALHLERRIGPVRFMRLIESNGTLVELLKIIASSTPGLARDLLDLLSDTRVDRLLDRTIAAGVSIGTIHIAIRQLHDAAETSSLALELERRIGASRFLRMVNANGTIVELLSIIRDISPAFAQELIAALDQPLVERLVERAIDTGRSIGTINLALLALRDNLETLALGQDLERRIGAARFLRLLDTNGTIAELFWLIRDGSPVLAEELIASVDDALVERLVDRTIRTGRSIGTINLTLRALLGSPETSALSQDLERRIGAARFLRLIDINGTIAELFWLIRDGSPELAEELIAGLDDALVERLVDRTIVAGRSIGTLSFTLRTLRSLGGGKKPSGLHRALERRIGAARYLRLIEANGTVVELFGILQRSSRALTRDMIAALDEARVQRLIQKTIAARRSIAGLGFNLPLLRRRAEGLDLEGRFGAPGFWELLLGTGSFGALTHLMQGMSAEFLQQFLTFAHTVSQEQWEQMLERSDVFQLSELISQCPAVFGDTAGGATLLASVESQAPGIVSRSGWHQRNTSSVLLATSPPSPARTAVCQALDEYLAQLTPQQLSFSSLADAVYGLEMIYQRRPDARASLGGGLRTLLPSVREWTIKQTEDMKLPPLLFNLLCKSEFSDNDARYVVDGVIGCITPRVLQKALTSDILGTLWALFVLSRARDRRIGRAPFGPSLPLAFLRSVNDGLPLRVIPKWDIDELRARFSLIGLLALLGCKTDSSVVAALRVALESCGEAAAWWLCADQSFVSAWLVLRGIETIKPLPAWQKADFQRRLVSAAFTFTNMDPGAEYLRNDLLRRAK